MTNYYDPLKTLTKGVLDFLKVLLGGSAAIIIIDALSQTANALPATWDDFVRKWPLLIAALIVGLVKAANNFRKHNWKSSIKTDRNNNNGIAFTPLLIGLLALSLCAGCVTSTTRERSTDADGTYDFLYRATSAAAPFGKISETVHQMAYQGAGPDGGSLLVGQDSAGIDNTGQIEAIRAAGEITGQVVAALIQGGLIGGAPSIGGGGDAGALGAITSRITALEQIVTQIQSLMEIFNTLRE